MSSSIIEQTVKQRNAILACKHFQASNHTRRKIYTYRKNIETSCNKTVTTYSKKAREVLDTQDKTIHPDNLNQ